VTTHVVDKGEGHRWTFALMLAMLAMLAPFSIDTYLPAFPAVEQSLHASYLQVQQTLTTYLFTYAVMMLWHGSISDAVGRRPVILASLVVFLVSSIACALASTIGQLLVFRGMQGLAAGAGVVVGRAIIRDRFQDAQAQRLMSHVTLFFAVAPAIAPLIGGLILAYFNWHGIFVFLGIICGLLLLLCLWRLDETLPLSHRQSLHPISLAKNYWMVFKKPEFQWLGASQAFNFGGFFIYVMAAPVLLIRHLNLTSQQFAWFFIPAVIGMMTGAFMSGRFAGRLSPPRTIRLAYWVMFGSSLANVVYCLVLPPALPWSILAPTIYCGGMSLAMPSVTLTLLDMFPRNRGLVSSLQAFCQTMVGVLVAGALVPVLAESPLWLALGMLAFVIVGACCWLAYRFVVKRKIPVLQKSPI
jgi:DHA1 family bicyclomycin/chloramphenicol resistance-like MFS transporter